VTGAGLADDAPRPRLWHALDASGAADGPLPWREFALLLVLWIPLAWATTAFGGWQAGAVVLMLGLVVYWLLLPKAATSRPVPGWALVPLAAAFVGGIFVAGYMAEADEHLTGAGYWVWFVAWLQFGLWLRDVR
jgi:hypothetical protein